MFDAETELICLETNMTKHSCSLWQLKDDKIAQACGRTTCVTGTTDRSWQVAAPNVRLTIDVRQAASTDTDLQLLALLVRHHTWVCRLAYWLWCELYLLVKLLDAAACPIRRCFESSPVQRYQLNLLANEPDIQSNLSKYFCPDCVSWSSNASLYCLKGKGLVLHRKNNYENIASCEKEQSSSHKPCRATVACVTDVSGSTPDSKLTFL